MTSVIQFCPHSREEDYVDMYVGGGDLGTLWGSACLLLCPVPSGSPYCPNSFPLLTFSLLFPLPPSARTLFLLPTRWASAAWSVRA